MAEQKTETSEYAAMMGRMLRSYTRRVATGDLSDLHDLVVFSEDVEKALGDAVRTMRAEQGYSWAQIASAFGVTRQSAQQRWGGSGLPSGGRLAALR